MAFQPIVDVSQRRVVYYEALVRGVNGESAFSILNQVTDELMYRFDQACRVKAIELASELGMTERLSINFLPNAVYEPEACIQSTLDTSRRVGWPTERLNFEITETERVVDRAHMRNIIDSYRRMGFTTSLDDFGNGYANLDLLTDLRPDTLKIDRELVMGCDSNVRRQAILKSMVSLARTLGTQLVAEGVETREESRCLLALGISVQQGYYFARPQIGELPTVAPVRYD
ncbi:MULTISPECIES: EAL domain-containing protein [Halomonadaceae]|jgi:EAL domain-containing protein (putative c-di-GMP-specific phosphodiesterase class I)|uniref:EAL domain-containing protein n=1 Tax=Vreelandella piezotolerans TaxID=2609667 RepID=A0ABQ6XBW5_9GAMM|nr:MULTISPECIES: EAL domain-containing protein [Halomonas]KAE8439496.1 EAL domain-containing protein [Halomonas piezotolerans]MCG7576162.1 EAL domain-containing protein [Halomonas sp. MMH1-48]MCG7590065.1 EAL domain-containing protein [Halomonas sp. McD50-5]MCG7603058.1 EAL domain-containing protein [Halomonas sp. MM17-34]MCG7612308.1 EAL domain-containing protein [Halomonas sp. MM17-29]